MRIRLTRVESHKAAVFVLTFFSYALFHANRKAFSNVKSSTAAVWTPHNLTDRRLQPEDLWYSHDLFATEDDAEKFEGVLDTAFMLAYAVGLFLNGYIGDRVNMRILLAVGMGSTSVLGRRSFGFYESGAVFVFGCIAEWTLFYNKYFYTVIWIVNGLMQSTGWPVVVACMGNWFGQSSRGVLLGLWSSCASVGNIIGALLVSSVLSYGYQYAFLVTSAILLSGSFIVLFGLIPSPIDVGLELANDDKPKSNVNTDRDDVEVKTRIEYSVASENVYVITIPPTRKEPLLGAAVSQPIVKQNYPSEDDDVTYDIQATRPTSMSFFKACLLPGVIPYALAYAFLKLVNYSFFFWLPFYLHNAFKWEESVADQLSTAYDVAGIVGGTVVGFMSDRLGKRTIMIVPMLIFSIPSLLLYSYSPNDRLVNTVLMSLIGCLIGGAANLISAAVSADLGCQKQIQGDDRALATVTGIIDGTGSFGAALGQIAVPYLQTGLGWPSVFYLFMICMFLTAVCLFPLFVKEIRSIRWPCLRRGVSADIN